MPFPTAVGFSGERCDDCLQLKQNEFVIRSSMSIIVCQAQILVASIVDVGVGAQVRLSLLFSMSDSSKLPRQGWESHAVACSDFGWQ